MIRAVFPILFAALAWPAFAAENPCQNIEKDPEFTTCWSEEFKKSEAEVARRLRVLAERHRKDEPNLHRLMTEARARGWSGARQPVALIPTSRKTDRVLASIGTGAGSR